MNINSLPPELQEDFRRNFPEMFEENITENVSTSDNNIQLETPEEFTIDDVVRNFPEMFESESQDIEDTTAEIIQDSSTEEVVDEEDDVEFNQTSANEPTTSLDLSSIDINNNEDSIVATEEPIEDIKVQYSRFKGADWFKIVQSQSIILAGLGGIGSYVNYGLSRLGPAALYLFDDDLFESHNMSGQFVSKEDINKYKVDVAKKHSINFSNYTPLIYPYKYIKGQCMTSKVMICGFDNMKARKDFYESWKEDIIPSEAHEYLFIDGRLLAEEYQIFCIKGDDTFSQSVYEKDFLFSDDEIEEVDCTLKQTSHMAMMIGSVMVSYFINFCNNLSPDNFPRRLPFFTHYNGLMNTYGFEY